MTAHWLCGPFIKFCKPGPASTTRLERRGTMTLKRWNSKFAMRCSAQLIAVAAIVILGLLGGLLHQHESASDEASCSYCQAGLQTPVKDLVCTLTVPFLEVFGPVDAERPSISVPARPISTRTPRAPPVTTSSVISISEGRGVISSA
jgi:hypothetical protein